MKCKKVQRLLPLYVGSDLSSKKSALMKAHLEECKDCGNEQKLYILSREKMRDWLSQDRIGWNENDWNRIVRTAIHEDPRVTSPLAPWPFKKAWTYALMLSAALIFFVLFVNPSWFKTNGKYMQMLNEKFKATEVKLQPASEQDTVSMILVSKETGLKINWFFNKNFKLEENP